MVDDRKPARARTHVGDRNDTRRVKTPPLGYPVHVDHEETPPPQLPPAPPTGEAREERLDRIEAALAAAIEGIGRVWNVRDGSNQWDRLEQNVAAIAAAVNRHDASLSEFVIPGIKDTIGAVDEVSRQMPRLIGQVEAVVLHVTALDKRVHDLELETRIAAERTANSNLATQSRLSSVENVQNALDVRLTKLEQRDRDEKVAERAIAKSDRRRLALVRAGWGVAFVVGSWVINHLGTIKSLFASLLTGG